MKNTIKIVFRALSIVFGIFGIMTAISFWPFLRATRAVEKLDEGLYYMEYHGDDGFDKLMEKGGIRNTAELAAYVTEFLSNGFSKAPSAPAEPAEYGCSALTVSTPEGGALMGRNFDFDSATGMILHTYPKHGYESITTFNVEFFGFGEGWLPESFKNKYLSLTGLFIALDGVNEKGLAIADLMAGDNVETHQDTGKPALTTTAAIRYLLRNAADVDEAIELLEGIDMHSDIGSAHHYAISDASGKSVVVEYVDNRMVVVDSHIAANHYLCEEKLNVGLLEDDGRYDTMYGLYQDAEGVMSLEDLTEAIQSVSQPEHEGEFLGTAWTMVMDLGNPSVTYWSRRHYDKAFHFEIDTTGQ